MQYEDLHRRYGAHVSQRLKRELSASEFTQLDIDALSAWLETRAETAHETYRRMLNNPLATQVRGHASAGMACRRWREAEDLSYLVAVADDVGETVRAAG